MQILIDSAVETPISLRHAALLVSYWASLEESRLQGNDASINDPSEAITLIADRPEHTHHGAAKRPTPPPVGPASTPAPGAPLPPGNQPVAPVVHPERHPDAPPLPIDPAAVFGVPAGTTGNPPTPPAPSTATAPVFALSAAPAAGSAPLAPTTQQGGTVVSDPRDKAGIPWDGRIHSDTRKQNADGSWRFRRNLDESMKASVMAELKAAAAQQVPLPPGQSTAALAASVPMPPKAPPVPQQPVAAHSVPDAPVAPVSLPPIEPRADSLPLYLPAVVGVPDPPNTGVVSAPKPVTGFRELMTKINVARAKGQLSQEQVEAACRAEKIDSITELAAQPALVPAVDAQLNRFLGAAA